jgi:hypothetical protein
VNEDTKLRHGYGRFRIGAEKYEGQWVNDVIQGKGKYEFAGTSFVPTFFDSILSMNLRSYQCLLLLVSNFDNNHAVIDC